MTGPGQRPWFWDSDDGLRTAVTVSGQRQWLWDREDGGQIVKEIKGQFDKFDFLLYLWLRLQLSGALNGPGQQPWFRDSGDGSRTAEKFSGQRRQFRDRGDGSGTEVTAPGQR